MTEGRSTGIPKILHAMQANGSPSPLFDFDEDHSFFMCRLPIHPQATMPDDLLNNANTTSGWVEGLVEGFVESQREILRLVSMNQRISKREMAERLGISTTAVDKNISALKARKLLNRVGSATTGHWEVM